MNEFDIIRHFFSRPSNTILGIGDDAAVFAPRPDHHLHISKDLLIAGRHFPEDAPPQAIGHKALAVNLSDMAAMGATPRYFLLGLALPNVNEQWLKQFSGGLFSLAEQFNLELIGGDTTCGALCCSVTIIGDAPAGDALRRDGAKVGDEIWVSGEIGWAGLGLAEHFGNIQLPKDTKQRAQHALHFPKPQVHLGIALRPIAHAAIDISDGLLADLRHIVHASSQTHLTLQAVLSLENIPLPYLLRDPSFSNTPFNECAALSFGDDYQLCFTASPHHHDKINALAQTLNIPLTHIGHIQAAPQNHPVEPIQLLKHQTPLPITHFGFDHFS